MDADGLAAAPSIGAEEGEAVLCAVSLEAGGGVAELSSGWLDSLAEDDPERSTEVVGTEVSDGAAVSTVVGSIGAASAGPDIVSPEAIMDALSEAAQMPLTTEFLRIAPQRNIRFVDRRAFFACADPSPTGWPINEIPQFRWDAGTRRNTIEDASKCTKLIARTPRQNESPSILRLPSHPNV